MTLTAFVFIGVATLAISVRGAVMIADRRDICVPPPRRIGLNVAFLACLLAGVAGDVLLAPL